MLKELHKILKKRNYQTYLRGDRKAMFLFVKGAITSAEVSVDGKNLWIEFWKTANEEEDDPPVKEKTCKTIEEVVEAISSWIR